MHEDLPNSELIDQLRRAASIWFKNDDLLLIEELIRRYRRAVAFRNAVRTIVEDNE